MHEYRWMLVVGCFTMLGVFADVPFAHAQDVENEDEPDQTEYREEGAGFFAIGTNVISIDALNDRLAAFGYPTYGSAFLSLGGGGYGVVGGRVLLGGEGYGLIRPSQSVRGRDVSVGGGYGLATLGYLAWSDTQLRVYPQVGIGAGGFTVDIGSAGDANDFDDVLNRPNRRAELTQGSLLVSLGMGATYEFSRADESGGFRIGLQVGYLLALYDSEWQLDDASLDDGPDAGFDGPFIRLLIGGGGGD